MNEALRTFNCGIGFCLIVDPKEADGVVAALNAAGETASRIGMLTPRGPVPAALDRAERPCSSAGACTEPQRAYRQVS